MTQPTPIDPTAPHALDAPGGARHRTPLWLWIAAALLLGVAVLLQRPGPVTQPDPGAIDPPGPISSTGIISKVILGVHRLEPTSPATARQLRTILSSVTSGFGPPPAWEDQLRLVAPVAATLGHDDAITLLDELDATIEQKLAAAPPEVAASPQAGRARALLGDVRAARMLVARLKPDTDASVPMPTQPALDALRAHHTWFADLLLETVSAQSPDGPRGPDATLLRDAASSSGIALVIVLAVVGLVIIVALLGGLAMLLVLGVLTSSGTLHPVNPERRWSEPGVAPFQSHIDARVWLETCCAFLLLFLGVKLLGGVAVDALTPTNAPPPDWLAPASIALQWLVLPAIFWPMLRGASFTQWRRGVGLTSARGPLREVGVGVVAYLAFVPVYAIVAIAAALVIMLAGMGAAGAPGSPDAPYFPQPAPLPTNPILELIGSADALTIIMLGMLATIWAPIVEETIFRGALYRQLRARLTFIPVALLTALAFASLHGYMAIQLFIVGSLGVAFACMREWRGSTIPSITAHCIHNAAVTIMMVSVAVLARI